MDMGMDVNWCLTCSKRTLDSQSPYCSEQCRQGDLNAVTPNAQAMSTTPLSACIQLPKNPRRLTASRPPLAPIVPVIVTPTTEPFQRDRRAFSFPASQLLESSSSPKSRRDSNILPAFARKPQITHYATTTNTTPVMTGLKKPSLRVLSGNGGLSKSSGATTPLALDSVFCSTSESSDNEGVGLKPRMGTGSTARPSATRASRSARPSLPAEFKAPKPPSPSCPAKAPSYLSSKQYAQRKQSQSPVSSVAAAIASSSSSRSREDIMAWAQAVKSREGDIEVNEDDLRGRSRTRRQDSSTIGSTIEEEPLSTTPKGPLQSVFAGLGIGRLGIVKALTSVTGSAATPAVPQSPSIGSLGLHSIPAPATVSKVDVTASSGGYGNDDNQVFFGGATPTLSTMSISEANEPTIATDNVDHDHVDMVTDDQQSAISSLNRRGSTQARLQYQQSSSAKSKEPQSAQPQRAPTSVIWNLSNYIRSFAPFSIPTATPEARSSKTSTAKTTPSVSTSTQVSEPVSAPTPLPVSRVQSPTSSPPVELVRSIPMDIKVPVGGHEIREQKARELAEKTAHELARSRRSKSRRLSRSRSRSRDHSIGRSRGRLAPTPHDQVLGHARQWSYDADLETDDEAVQVDRRGRSHNAKVLGADDGMSKEGLAPLAIDQSRSRSRGRNENRASRSRGRRESPARGRGRDRTIRV